MKNFKSKIIMSVLAVCVLSLMLPVTVFAAVGDTFEVTTGDNGTTNIGAEMTFKVITEPTATENGTVQVGNGTNASVPTSTNGAITIPKTVTRTVGSEPYTYTVTAIGDYAFLGRSLTRIIIPDSVTSIGIYAFERCTDLTTVDIPNSVTSIGDRAFGVCDSLRSVTIGNSVTSIGNFAFTSTNLSTVTIPESVTSIGYGAFSNCANLTEINVDANNTAYLDEDGVLFNKDKTTIITYPKGKSESSYTIPSSVTSIEYRAFSDCTALSSVTIPDSVTSIGDGAFWDCTALSSVTIPDGVTSIGDTAFAYCTALSSVTIPDSVTSIGYYAFEYCTALSSVTIPDSVTSIGDGAFQNTALSSVTIPDSVTSIGDTAFAYCTALSSVIIGNSVTSIGDDVFYDSTNLANIYFTGDMPTIGNYVAPQTSTNVYYPSLATGWDTYATRGKKVSMTSYAVTNTLTNMTGVGEAYIINDATVSVNFPYTVAFTPNAGYALPQSISVLTNGTALTSGYDYSPTTGILSITNSGITGDVEIVAQARMIQTGADITGFSIAGQEGTSNIDTTAHAVTLTMPHGTDVTALVPTITVSEGATINPASGTAQNFMAPIFYTVTAENGEAQEWVISLAVAPAPVPAPTVPPTVTPQTGDDFNPIIWISIAIISLSAVGFTVKKKA